jgi:Ni,Fe-hydrogenase III small subunit
MAALVYDDPSGTAVFATNEAPPGVYAERVKKHALWVPGAAVATPAVKQALARASSAAPSRGTTFLVGDGAIRGVVLTDAPPIPGVHREVAGPLHAWIAGVEVPTPAQREAIAAALPLAGAPH